MDNTPVTISCQDIYSGQCRQMGAHRVLRRIADRRVVYEGFCGETEAVIKLFVSRVHGKRHWNREKRGFEELARRGLRTAPILAGGRTPDGYYALALEKIQNADDLFSMREKGATVPQQALEKLLQYLAQMHEAGIYQRDLHLGNFLWDGHEIYALDPAMMVFSRGPLDGDRSIRQAAALLTNFTEQNTRETVMRAYSDARRWDWSDAQFEQIERLCHSQRLRTVEKDLKKTLRPSKRFIKERAGSLDGVFDRTVFEGTDIRTFMQGLDALMESGQILKCGNTCFVSRVRINGRDAVIKRYNHKGLLHSLRHTVKGSRARKCWLFGHRLSWLGVPCAKPLAFIEQRQCGLIRQSYIINEFVDGQNILQWAAERSCKEKQRITAKTLGLLQQLLENQMTHGDLKAGNILVTDSAPVLIDLDSMRNHRFGWMLRCKYSRMLDDFKNRIAVPIG